MDPVTDDDPTSTDAEVPEITVYWRPGCMYCMALKRSLSKAGVETTDVNIWDVDGAREIVRAAANGNETVPTVEVGGRFYVNPSARQVMAAAGIEPAEGSGRRWPFSR